MLPFLSHWVVCQNSLEVDQKSLTTTCPNSSHTQLFASLIVEAAALLVTQYLSAFPEGPWTNQPRKASLCSIMATLTTSVHSGHLVYRHNRHQSSNRMQNIPPEMGVEDPMDRGLHQMFPVHPHYSFGFTRSVRQPPPPSDPTHSQLVIS